MSDEAKEVWTYELNDRPYSSFIALFLDNEIRGHLVARSKKEQDQVVRLLERAGVKNVADNTGDSQRD